MLLRVLLLTSSLLQAAPMPSPAEWRLAQVQRMGATELRVLLGRLDAPSDASPHLAYHQAHVRWALARLGSANAKEAEGLLDQVMPYVKQRGNR